MLSSLAEIVETLLTYYGMLAKKKILPLYTKPVKVLCFVVSLLQYLMSTSNVNYSSSGKSRSWQPAELNETLHDTSESYIHFE